MIYFDQDYINFFSELEKNNDRDWFQANKMTYEKKVKQPFTAFFSDLLNTYEKHYGEVPITPKQGLFRINRDIRFSKDKTPYKIHMAGMISKSGKKDHSYPGIYCQANHVDVRIYSGCHGLDKNQLYAVRTAISKNLQGFDKLINEPAFKSTFGEILGEKNKRLPAEFTEASMQQPLIFNKNFYYFFKLEPSELLKEGLIDEVMKRFSKADKVNAFFIRALGQA